MNIAIVGLGDVGLPLAMQLSRPNHSSVRYHELAEWSHCIVDNAKRHGRRLYCTRKGVESIGTHERNEVTETQGFSLVFTARPHISFTIWLIGFFPSTRFGMSSRRSLREGTGALGDPYHLPMGTRGYA